MSSKIVPSATRYFFTTSIGKKYLMGLTGLVWAGFVFAHMAGNMLLFVSPDAYNRYGHFLVSGNLIYVVEAVLIISLLIHVSLAISLTLENRKSRGSERYAVSATGAKAASLASRTMAVQGSLILVFIITHLATFKYGTYYEATVDGVVMRDLHRLVVEVFKQPGYFFWYVVALILLGFHLKHGMNSIFQSFGLLEDKYIALCKKIGWVYGLVVAAGFLSQPLYVYFIVGS